MGKAIRKIVIGFIVGAVLFGGTRALGFPIVFQVMFFCYAVLGTVVFLMLDAPSVKPIAGAKALISLVVFYVILCAVYIAGASLWPQYDPDDEKGKIDMLLEKKKKYFEQGKTMILLEKAEALDVKAKELAARLKALGLEQAVQSQAGQAGAPGATIASLGDNALRIGEQQWELQECYNCHKLRGEGGKKRGPELDNIGNLMTVEEIATKIIDPKSFKAEGFDKEFKKGKMPDKYRDLMEQEDVTALAVWLATFKNTAVNTPKPIKMK